jgi:nucleotide-binding universal stress UspA family protein
MADNICPINGLARVLLTTDGSEYGSGAEREAISMAKRCTSKLYAMTIIETNVEFSALAPDVVEKEEVKVRKGLDAVKARAEEAGVVCETIVHEGDTPYKFIVDEADKRDAGMIVMGRRGRSAAEKIAMGSVTARVIGHTNRMILVVPRAANVECKKILLATDGSEHSETAAVEAVNMAKNCGVTLMVMSVAGNDSEKAEAEANIDKVRDLAGQLKVEVDGIVATGKPGDAIVATAVERAADLVIMGSHGRSGLSRLLLGSVAEGVVNNTECAVLIAKA